MKELSRGVQMKMWLFRVAKAGFQEHSQKIILTVAVVEQGAHRGWRKWRFRSFAVVCCNLRENHTPAELWDPPERSALLSVVFFSEFRVFRGSPRRVDRSVEADMDLPSAEKDRNVFLLGMGLCLGLQECCWAVQPTGYHPSHCHSSAAQLQRLPKFVFCFTYGMLRLKMQRISYKQKARIVFCHWWVLQQRELNGTLSLWLCDEIWWPQCVEILLWTNCCKLSKLTGRSCCRNRNRKVFSFPWAFISFTLELPLLLPCAVGQRNKEYFTAGIF